MKIIQKIKSNYILICILLFAIFLRLYNINFQSAWLDEVLNLKESDPNVPFNEAYDVILLRDATSFMYIFSVRFLSFIIGHSVFTARLISAIAGILSIFYLYKLGEVILNKRVGYFAAILLSVNPFHIEYSQEARSYTFLVLFVIISFYRLYKFINNINITNAVYLGVFTGLVINSHPIGLLNVGTIYLILFFVLIILNEKKRRLDLIKYSIISFSITSVLFCFVYPMILSASKITSFWIPAPSFQGIKQVLIDVTGRSEYFFYFIIIGVLFVSIKAIASIKMKNSILQNKLFLGYSILILWVVLEVGVIIVKSYLGVSIVLARYLIAILPALILILALGIEITKPKLTKYLILSFLFGFFVYNIFYSTNYSTTIRKAQFDKITEFISNKNTNEDKVVSRFGFVLSAYLNKTNPNIKVTENTLDDFTNSMRNNGISKTSFWYLDGNSATINLSVENQKFLNENFILQDTKQLFDCFTYHYILKNEEREIKNQFVNNELKLFFKDFKPSVVDEHGNLMMFENSIVKSKQIRIPKGEYTLVIQGSSYPSTPIQGENAHLIIRVNNKEIDNYFLSEKQSAKTHEIKFKNDLEKIIFSIEFDNDYSVDKLDRNVILNQISIKSN